MTEDEFWKHVSLIDSEALFNGDEDGALSPLIDSLVTLSVEEIQSFEDNMTHALYRLDGRVYHDAAGDSAGSADGFLYARCFVVGMGKQFFNDVLADPTKMPKTLDQWFEPLLYTSQITWSTKTGFEPEDWKYFSDVSYETGSNSDLWKNRR